MVLDPQVAAQYVAGAFSLGSIILTAWIARRTREVHYQVKNNHDTNLREDVDELWREVVEGNHLVRQDIAGINRSIEGVREDLRSERRERIEGDKARGNE